jgi:hypothetical protein
VGTQPARAAQHSSAPRLAHRLTGTYGLVLALIVIDYLLVSTLTSSLGGKAIAVFFLGVTLVATLRVSRSRRIWQLLAVAFLLVSTLLALASDVTPRATTVTQYVTVLAGVLLVVTPLVIARNIASHPIITTQTVLGAVCIYLLIGFSFAFMYWGLALLGPSPFFVGQSPATMNNTLFFSYTTLTTVGYGNLVPAQSLGQTCAILEALIGPIYLVLIVARLVSLWGQRRPLAPHDDQRQRLDASSPDAGDVSDDSV